MLREPHTLQQLHKLLCTYTHMVCFHGLRSVAKQRPMLTLHSPANSRQLSQLGCVAGTTCKGTHSDRHASKLPVQVAGGFPKPVVGCRGPPSVEMTMAGMGTSLGHM